MSSSRWLSIALFVMAAPAVAQNFTGGPCSASSMHGTYSLSLNGRIISPNGAIPSVFEGVGTAVFDGKSNVTLSGTSNTNQASEKQFTYSGTYTLASNCFGSITLTQGSSATFALVVWSNGQQFDITGSDPSTTASPNSMIYSGNGSSVAPPACGTASFSGAYTFDATGFTLSGTALHDAGVESGLFQFDGQGNVTATYSVTGSQTAAKQVTWAHTQSARIVWERQV